MALTEQYVNGVDAGVYQDTDGTYYLDDGTPLLEYSTANGQYVEETDPTTLYNVDGTVADSNYNSATPANTSVLTTVLSTVGSLFGNKTTTSTGKVVVRPPSQTSSTGAIVLCVLGAAAIGVIAYVKLRKK